MACALGLSSLASKAFSFRRTQKGILFDEFQNIYFVLLLLIFFLAFQLTFIQRSLKQSLEKFSPAYIIYFFQENEILSFNCTQSYINVLLKSLYIDSKVKVSQACFYVIIQRLSSCLCVGIYQKYLLETSSLSQKLFFELHGQQ